MNSPQSAASFRNGRSHSSGFTLIELLTAASITMVLFLFLASVLHQSGQIWNTSQKDSQTREQARLALEMIGAELRQAVLPVNPSETPGIQFIQNPTNLPQNDLNRDALFWLAPIATPTSSSGDLAAVGYFVRADGDQFNLCRFYIPSSSGDFLVYSHDDWITDVIDAATPASSAQNYRGLFLENTPGIWIKAYRRNASNEEEVYIPDSRNDRALPDRVEISLVFFEQQAAARVGELISAEAVSALARQSDNASAFIVGLPEGMRRHTNSITLSVPLASRFKIL